MSLRKSAIAAAAAVAMIGMPTVVHAAQANAASKLSVRAAPAVKNLRAGAAKREASNLGGGSTIIAVIAAVAVIAGIVIAADGSDSP